MNFSKTEKEHLLRAWFAISLAFAILMGNILSAFIFLSFLISLLTVGLGFLVHEIAHKYIATRYGCAAEFRSDNKMLLIAILSSFFGFIFAAPGAVIILGHVNKKKAGIIAFAGPFANVVLAIVFLLLTLSTSGLLNFIFLYGLQINGFLALFNMLPFFVYDGAKIISWNKFAYFGLLVASALLVIVSKIFS